VLGLGLGLGGLLDEFGLAVRESRIFVVRHHRALRPSLVVVVVVAAAAAAVRRRGAVAVVIAVVVVVVGGVAVAGVVVEGGEGGGEEGETRIFAVRHHRALRRLLCRHRPVLSRGCDRFEVQIPNNEMHTAAPTRAQNATRCCLGRALV
jgi:hypothetical protein